MKTSAIKLSAGKTQRQNSIVVNNAPLHSHRSLSIFPAGDSFVQAKLRIGQPNDRYEQEAERVADQVMRTSECPECVEDRTRTKPIGDQITPLIQRDVEPKEDDEVQEGENVSEEDEEAGQTKLLDGDTIQRENLENGDEEEKEEDEDKIESLQTRTTPGKTPTAPPGLQDKINSLNGDGQPLSDSIRNYFEPRFGFDFGKVRVHADSRAAAAARSVHARAFTTGSNIIFNSGQYSPETSTGRRLLGHELTHVLQQGSSASAGQAPMLQAASFWEIMSDVPIIGLIVRALRSEFSDEELYEYLSFLAKNNKIQDFVDSDNKASDIVRRWKRGEVKYDIDQGFKGKDAELSAVELKILLIKELLAGSTFGDDETAILDILTHSPDVQVERILGKGGVSYKKIKEDFSGDNLEKLEAFRNRRISSTDKELEKGSAKVRPEYVTSSFGGGAWFHFKDSSKPKGWNRVALKRARRLELLLYPASGESKFPAENYFHVRITMGKYRNKVGFVEKSKVFFPTKTRLSEAFKKDVKKPRKVSLVFFQSTERIGKRMEDIGIGLTTTRTNIWEKDPKNPSLLRRKMSGKRFVTIGKDRTVVIRKKVTFDFKKSEKTEKTSSFFDVRVTIRGKDVYGFVEKTHLKSDIKKRERERDYFMNVAKKYVSRGPRLRTIYVDPYSQKCEDRPYPIEYYSGSEIKNSIVGAKNCTDTLVSRIHIVAHGGTWVIAGHGDLRDSYGLYLKSLAENISRNEKMKGLTTEEFSQGLKDYLTEDVSIWLHACSTGKKHEIKTTGSTIKVKGFAEELAEELRAFHPKATVRGFRTKGRAGRDPKLMVVFPKK